MAPMKFASLILALAFASGCSSSSKKPASTPAPAMDYVKNVKGFPLEGAQRHEGSLRDPAPGFDRDRDRMAEEWEREQRELEREREIERQQQSIERSNPGNDCPSCR